MPAGWDAIEFLVEGLVDAHDFEGHGQLANRFDTAIATGEMLTSFDEHAQLVMAGPDFMRELRTDAHLEQLRKEWLIHG